MNGDGRLSVDEIFKIFQVNTKQLYAFGDIGRNCFTKYLIQKNINFKLYLKILKHCMFRNSKSIIKIDIMTGRKFYANMDIIYWPVSVPH